MLPFQSTFKKMNRKAASAAWDAHSLLVAKYVRCIFALGMLIAGIFAVFFSGYIGAAICATSVMCLFSLLIFFVVKLVNTYKKQMRQKLSFFKKNEIVFYRNITPIFLRARAPDLRPPRFSA
ncbi:hypothetical protein ACO0K0_03920 [Undibacterium sp. SXout11W]|uniref:hypothetical protein n=1 Tax=Undibacterium sp. SXout11W TaxID=3413050 RepID=UPI003BEF6411